MMVGGGAFEDGGILSGEGVRPRRSSGEKGSLPVSSALLICYYMLHLDAGGGGIFREVVRPRMREGEFVGGVSPSVRSGRYTKMAELYVMPSASVVLARNVRRRLRRVGHRGWCRRMADANEKADGQQMLEQVVIKVYIYILYRNKVRSVGGRVSRSHINRQRLEVGEEPATGRCTVRSVRRRAARGRGGSCGSSSSYNSGSGGIGRGG